MALTYEQMTSPKYDVMNDAAIDETWKYVAPLAGGLKSALLNKIKAIPSKQIPLTLGTTEEILEQFYNLNNPNLEIAPPKYFGKRSYEAVLDHLGSKDGNFVNIKTPQRPATINRNNLKHLLFENNPERLENLNEVKQTFEKPTLIIKGERNGNAYNYYAKPYLIKDKVRGHLNIAKDKENGQFYQTNFHLRKNKLRDFINNGQITYSDLPFPTAPVQNSTPVTNIINDLKTNFNPSSLFEKIMTNFRK